MASLVAALGFVSASPARVAGPRLPTSFFGMVTSDSLTGGQVNLGAQAAAIRSSGTGSIRFPIYWSAAQPYPSWRDVPPAERSSFMNAGGRPTTFAQIDRQILTFASHGLRMLPVILQAPAWARIQPALTWSPPAVPVQYGRFVGAVVRRYGPRGQFWAEHPALARLAPRSWQIWNEPAGGETPEGASIFWQGPKPYEPRYIAMLRDARRAARAADPHAQIVLAGLFGRSWEALAGIYAHGGRGLFDAVAVHPYANTPAHVLKILQYVHRTLVREHAGRLPLLVTETDWASSLHHAPLSGFGIETTAARQASNLAAEYPLLVAHRRELNLQAIFWYTWIGSEPSQDEFQYAGLLRLTPDGRVQAKPAYRSYLRTLRRLEG